MKFIQIITLACISRCFLCALKRNLWVGIVDSTKPTPSPRSLIEDALARTEARMSSDYSSFRPFVMKGWEKDEDMIMVMINEAAYTFKFAEKVAESILRNSHRKEDVKLRGIIKKFQSYCHHVLELTEQKVAQLTSDFPSSKLENSNEPENRGEIQKLRLSATEKNNMAFIQKIRSGFNYLFNFTEKKLLEIRAKLCDPTQYKSIENLKECFNEIENSQRRLPIVISPSLKLQFEQAIFQVVEYLYKYQLIGPKELSIFYTGEGKVLESTGKHIKKRVSLTAWYLPFLHKPQDTFGIMHHSVDYLQHSLNGLEDTSKKLVFHTAFSECIQSLKNYYNLEKGCPLMNEVLEFLTQDTFLEHLSKWTLNPNGENKDILNKHVAGLIKHFMDPEEYFIRHQGPFSESAYYITSHMMKYIYDNISEEQSLEVFFRDNGFEYDHFKLQLKLLGSLDNLMHFYGKQYHCIDALESGVYNLFSKNQLEITLKRIKEEIGRLKKEYSEVLKVIKSNRKLDSWIENKIISSYLEYNKGYIS